MKPSVPPPSSRRGYTLIEILVATTLALMLMTTVVALVGTVGESITESRSMLESADRLRLAETRLQMDLAGITATVCPTLKPEDNEGYFEYIEGPASSTVMIAVNIDTGNGDPTVGDFDDILMFTTRTTGKPFVGKFGPGGATIESNVAEVAWFLRGRNLHRRVLLVAPDVNVSLVTPQIYFRNYDISARYEATGMKANSLGDLTRRECRFAHTGSSPLYTVPWGWTYDSYTFPTLPTLNECSSPSLIGLYPGTTYIPATLTNLDFWTNASGHRLEDNAFISGATNSTRISDDIILTNVIGFDVKAWDPVTGDYENLGHNPGSSFLGLGHYGQPLSPLAVTSNNVARVYDTWSTSNYNNNWNDGFDNDGDGIVDDDDEKVNPPPYPIPLRGIQVKIRVFEPDSRQVRTVTVRQEFLPR